MEYFLGNKQHSRKKSSSSFSKQWKTFPYAKDHQFDDFQGGATFNFSDLRESWPLLPFSGFKI